MSSFFKWLKEKFGGSAEPRIEWIDPADLILSEVRHERLTDVQMERIERLYNTFSAATDMPLDTWVTNFKRDMDPDKELAVWESMAAAFVEYTRGKTLDREASEDVLQVLLLRSGCSSPDEVIEHLNLKVLSDNDAREIIRLY